MPIRSLSAAAAAVIVLAACATPGTQSAPPPPTAQPGQHSPAQQAAGPRTWSDADDPHIWLEDIEGERSMAWVRERNARSLGTLQGDPRYDRFYNEALRILEARDRIAFPSFRGADIENFWQDSANVRGLWRKTTLASYRTDNPTWTTILDVDSLARAENANWVYRGASCLPPADRKCLVFLSDGGKDANVIREFDRETRSFVRGGFEFPESKGGVSWLDENTVLVNREFGPGSLTSSGYPHITKVLSRGHPIDHATELFRGDTSDVWASVNPLRDHDGNVVMLLASRGKDFWNSDYWMIRDDGSRVPLPFPSRMSLRGLVGGQGIFTTQVDWREFKAGDLLAFDMDELKRNPATAQAYLILRPGPRDAIQGTTTTRNRLLVSMTENVRGVIYAYERQGNTRNWTRTRVALPENATLNLGSASRLDDDVFFTASSYTMPTTLFFGNAATARAEKIKAIPDRFDASNVITEQFEATSKDGTKVPYFVTRPRNMHMNGDNPTLLYGYGGYQISLLPSYSGTIGKLWLEQGGVYVVANTRGGGEFGPSWHQAAQGKNRQRAHEDFIAVAQDIIARRITSPRRLGIMGGSQGGLFMGVAMTQHPELFNAAVIQVPLFDMMRFHRLLAGASWVAEYGNPDVPEQREWILEYSPYQALERGRPYPEAFIHTSTKDDRVHPGHARKAAARLEELGYPVLFYENTDGGHSAAANLRESARRSALEYTYLARKLKDPPRVTP